MPKPAPQAADSFQLLAANVQALRAEGNWSTRALAEQCHIGRATVQRIESLEFQTVTLQTLDRLARGLGVRTGSLVGIRPVARRETDKVVDDVLAANLVLARSLRGWTQDDLAQASGVARPDIGKIERRTRKPDLRTLERLGAALGLTVERLLTEAGKR